MEPLEPTEVPRDPYQLFAAWHEQAAQCPQIMYAGAMCLSTVGLDGLPDGRIVLLQDVGASGFAFMTDERSAKGQALTRSAVAALTFYWGPLERQVRVRGQAVAAPAGEADRYFQRRPRRSQVTAWACEQSRPAASKAALERRMEAAEKRFSGHEAIPRPPYWKTYRVNPREIEFWTARARRLHDRVLYTREEDGAWTIKRLCP